MNRNTAPMFRYKRLRRLSMLNNIASFPDGARAKVSI
jgi:hypothetical protein